MAFFIEPSILSRGDFDAILLQSIYPLNAPLSLRAQTHTEDGIPIRKIYVSNLPPQVTRTELHKFFEKYGPVKSCWVKNGEQNVKPYAFVTFIEPAHAYQVLTAPRNGCNLRGRLLRVLPADSWHQPESDADGNVIWSKRKLPIAQEQIEPATTFADEATSSAAGDVPFTILDVLNHDCLVHVLSYVGLHDLVRSEAVSKRWRAMVQEYFLGLRTFKTSSWSVSDLTTARLRHLLRRMGPTLQTLHIDDHGHILNDRTAHIVTKFCPNLERLMIDEMKTKYWSKVVHGCKNLHTISFSSCSDIDDTSLSSLLGCHSALKHLHLSGLELVTGKFLKDIVPELQSLTIYRCPNIFQKYLRMALPKMAPHLKSLNLKKVINNSETLLVLSALTNLEELTLSNVNSYNGTEQVCMCEEIAAVLEKMPELKVLALTRNRCQHEKLLIQIAKSCTKLRKLDLMGCFEDGSHLKLATGMAAIASACSELQHVDVSFNPRLTEVVGALAACGTLRGLVARGSASLTDDAILKLVGGCHQLQMLDVFACDKITKAVVSACVSELATRPRRMTLYLGETAAANDTDLPTHPLLNVDFKMRKYFINLLIHEVSDSSDYEHYNDMFSDNDYDDSDLSDLEDDDDYGEDHWGAIDLPPDFIQQLKMM